MIGRAPPLAALALAACGEGGAPEARDPPIAEAVQRKSPAPSPPPGATAPPAADKSRAASDSAAEVVRDYHRLIGAGDYGAAWRLREASPRNPAEEAFAAAYRQYAEYRVTVGAPSEPVSAGGWDYVEVPVQIYGRTRAGAPFASAGTVTVRRRTGSSRWRIAPG